MKNLLTLLAFFIIALGLYGIIKLFSVLFSSDIKVIAAFFAFLAAVIATLLTQYFTKRREEKNAHREKKIEIYSEFIDIYQRMLAGSNNKVDMEKVSKKELENFFFRFNRDILLWGSPGVIKAVMEFKKSSDNNANDKHLLFVINDLFKEFRKDIGLSNFGLNAYELIKVNLSNPEELDKVL